MRHRWFPLSCLALFSILLLARSAAAQQNAALLKYGAAITATCKHPTPLNQTWNKPVNMLADNPAGPIFNDLATAYVKIELPMKYHVVKVGLVQDDYQGGFAKVKDVAISAPGFPAKKVTLEDKPGTVQLFDYVAYTDVIEVQANSLYVSTNGTNKTYGALRQVPVMVTEDVAAMTRPPADIVKGLPVYLMRTPNLDPQAAAKVVGAPRKATGHPCTLWDNQDIAEVKEQIRKYPAAKDAYRRILDFCDKACSDKTQVPSQPDLGTNPEVASRHLSLVLAVGNLGIGYALSGREQYAREAKRILLDFAKYYEGWPVHRHPQFTHDASKWSWQRLSEAMYLIPAAWGFDLVYNSPSLSDADRAAISDHLIMPSVRQIMSSASIIAAPTNWSAVSCAAVMIGSRVCGNREFYEKSWMGLSRDPAKKDGGIFYHIDKGIDDDGLWAEGAMGYQFMAMTGLLVMAETLWHDGIDAYGYRDSRLKLVFDSPIWYCYTGGKSSPAIHDSGSESLFNRNSHLYQYPKRRYGEKAYDAILAKLGTLSLETMFQDFLPSFDFAPVTAVDLPRVPSIHFPGAGFAIGRCGDGEDEKYLLLDYGPNRSHGHPDKLNFVLYGLGQELFADPGSAWYSTDIYNRYYSTTLAHNTVSFNGLNQVMTDGKAEVYGTAGELAVMRATCDTAIPGAFLDRTLVLAGSRLYDIFNVRSNAPFTFELPYHCRGTLAQSVATQPWAAHPKERPGYAYYTDPVAAKTDADWSCSWTVEKGSVQLRVPGEPNTEVVFASTPMGADDLPTALIRRAAPDTVFASVSDLVPAGGAPSVLGLEKIGSPRHQGYLLRGRLAGGGEEIVLVNFTGDRVSLGGWTTDARVAFVRKDRVGATAFSLAGGTGVTGPGVSIRTEDPAFIAFRTVKDGLAVVTNLGETAARVTWDGFAAYPQHREVTREGPGPLKRATPEVALPGRASCEFVRGRQPTVAQYEEGIRRDRLARQAEAEAKEKREQEQAAKAQADAAKKYAPPSGYFVLVQAEDFVRQEGGSVNVTDRKTAAYGKSFLNWDNRGHLLEWDFDIAHEGYYQVVLKYCREGDAGIRSLMIDGEFPHDVARRMEMPATGGWSNGADNWQYYTCSWPLTGAPFLVHLKPGRHVLRLENSAGDGGMNLDYVVFVPAGTSVSRQAVER